MSVVSGSEALEYFCKEKSSESATCKKCNVKIIMCKGFSTSGLLRQKKTHTGSVIGNVQRKMMMFVKQQAF